MASTYATTSVVFTPFTRIHYPLYVTVLCPTKTYFDPAFSSSNILAGYERHPNIKTAEIEPASDHRVQN